MSQDTQPQLKREILSPAFVVPEQRAELFPLISPDKLDAARNKVKGGSAALARRKREAIPLDQSFSYTYKDEPLAKAAALGVLQSDLRGPVPKKRSVVDLGDVDSDAVDQSLKTKKPKIDRNLNPNDIRLDASGQEVIISSQEDVQSNTSDMRTDVVQLAIVGREGKDVTTVDRSTEIASSLSLSKIQNAENLNPDNKVAVNNKENSPGLSSKSPTQGLKNGSSNRAPLRSIENKIPRRDIATQGLPKFAPQVKSPITVINSLTAGLGIPRGKMLEQVTGRSPDHSKARTSPSQVR